MSDRGVCRTAPATPGLLKKYDMSKRGYFFAQMLEKMYPTGIKYTTALIKSAKIYPKLGEKKIIVYQNFTKVSKLDPTRSGRFPALSSVQFDRLHTSPPNLH